MDSRQTSQPLTDLELLQIVADMSLNARRRVAGVSGVQIFSARDGQLCFVGSEVPDGLVPGLLDAVKSSPQASAPDREPPALAACREILGPARGSLSIRGGPYFSIEPQVRARGHLTMVRSDEPPDERLRGLNPGNWEPDEWDDLLDGALGPWAMAVEEGRVVSICHTPRPMTRQAAECGVWTHPDSRGRGYAAEVTATWADILRPSGRYLFYSTDAQSLSSQRVAARLGLRPIGWIWHLTRVEPDRDDSRHPLSRPRS